MVSLSAIILSYTNGEKIHHMNLNCIQTLQQSELFGKDVSLEVIVIESNKNYHDDGYKFPPNVKVIVPEQAFNFHAYLNIGIAAAEGRFVALCNNDLEFQKEWFTEILKVKNAHPEIHSFSPVEPNEQWDANEYVLGYNVRKHIKGWCIVIEKDLFKTTGKLDEQFEFYYADDDYAMTLRKHHMPHAVVVKSVVRHLGGVNTESNREEGQSEYNRVTSQYPNLPKYLFTDGYKWILRNEKLLKGHLQFHKKWGSVKSIAWKMKLYRLLSILGCGHWVKW